MLNEVTLGKDGFYHDRAGTPFVRVTTVLKEFGFIDSQFFDDDSRDRGTAVHKAVEFRLKGTLNRKTMDPQLGGWIEAADAFVHDMKFEPMAIETIVSDPAYFYAGRVDAFGLINGRPSVVDVKSGAAGKATRLQTAAYARVLGQFFRVPKLPRYALELRPNGSYKLSTLRDENEEAVFAGLSAAYWYKYNLGLVKNSSGHRKG